MRAPRRRSASRSSASRMWVGATLKYDASDRSPTSTAWSRVACGLDACCAVVIAPHLRSCSFGQRERGDHDLAVALRREEPSRGLARDEVLHDQIDAAAEPEAVPDVRQDHGLAIGEAPFELGEVADRVLRIGAAREHEQRDALR